MINYIWIENMKMEVMIGFKQTFPGPKQWSNMPKFKIRICLTFDQYETLKNISNNKDVSFTLKNNGIFTIGYFNIDSILGLSAWREGRIIQINVSNLDSDKVGKDHIRDLTLRELFDELPELTHFVKRTSAKPKLSRMI